ncbi:pyridoxal phosphate-dependent decarboxylase family protein [Corallococcus sicarius]|uniref:Aminotransferase class I/II-fold pyridoxal phosphate-dependent enzyme n=1 Tax=Corallococcus sicarius TaxID=2316726 RepID=A0A3A8NRK6_9BACT|nr:aminotransferase class I/II-fold pyridoxal phosphate-dependent enzyme [Corallococcus sicarius]RKH47016.1 aminotransferase class I/II-fold pyridoxal phosphate-dependent enzyme [Corallococcus sicarius]
MTTPLEAAYDPDAFRATAHALMDQLADYLKAALGGGAAMPVLPWVPPAVNHERFATPFPEVPSQEPSGLFAALMARVLEGSHHLHHPRYVGHQVTAPLPLTALCDAVSSLLNNGMAVYEMGPVATAMEHHVLAWMASRLGLPASARGVLTSGGSAGNLTALLAARQAKAGFDAWNGGAHAGPPMTVLVPRTAHYCLARAVRIMGFGEGGLTPVDVDARFRVQPDALEAALQDATRKGRKVIAVVASAGSTTTGAFDPLEAVADFAQAHGLWFHVDGAHGAAASLSPKYRAQVRGIERADSVVWDAHKGLLMPALVTAVLFRDGARSFDAFAQEASYLFHGDDDARPYSDVALRTLECTKEMMSLKVYTCLSVLGTRLFEEAVTASYDQARRFAAKLQATPDFEVAVPPDCNIVCFRHTPAHVPEPGWDALQARLREALVTRGDFYLVQARLPRGAYLRTTLIHPLTRDEDLDVLLDTLREAARG